MTTTCCEKCANWHVTKGLTPDNQNCICPCHEKKCCDAGCHGDTCPVHGSPHQESWEKEFDDLFTYFGPNIIRDLKSFISSLLSKAREEGAKEALDEKPWIDFTEMRFAQGIKEERTRILAALDKKYEYANDGETIARIRSLISKGV
jgi:hypothetical protein